MKSEPRDRRIARASRTRAQTWHCRTRAGTNMSPAKRFMSMTRRSRREMLEVWPVCSPHAHAKILRRDASAARAMPGIAAVLLAEDVPGLNDVGAVRHDEILLADKEVFYHGQIVALVVGETQEVCRAAAEKVIVEYEPLPPIFTIEEAIAANSFHSEPNFIRRGDVDRSVARRAADIRRRIFHSAARTIFISRRNAAWAERGEDGTMFISSSTQHPSEVQHIVAHVLGAADAQRRCGMPAHGRRFWRKRNAGRDARGARRARRDQDRPQSSRSIQSRSGHDDHRETPSVSRRSFASDSTEKDCCRPRRSNCFPMAAGRSICRAP